MQFKRRRPSWRPATSELTSCCRQGSSRWGIAGACAPRSPGPRREATKQRPDTHDYSEAETRDLYHRPAAARGGLGARPSRDDREFAVEGMPNNARQRLSSTTCSGATTASRSALVEAKRTRTDAARRPAAGEALCRLPGSAVRPAAGDLLHQRLRALALGRHSLPAAPGAGLLQEGRAGAADPAPHQPQAAGGRPRSTRRSSSGYYQTARDPAHRRGFESDSSARRCW